MRTPAIASAYESYTARSSIIPVICIGRSVALGGRDDPKIDVPFLCISLRQRQRGEPQGGEERDLVEVDHECRRLGGQFVREDGAQSRRSAEVDLACDPHGGQPFAPLDTDLQRALIHDVGIRIWRWGQPKSLRPAVHRVVVQPEPPAASCRHPRGLRRS